MNLDMVYQDQALSEDSTILADEIRGLRRIGGRIVFEIARRLKFAKDTNLPKRNGMGFAQWAADICGIAKSTAYAYLRALDRLGEDVVRELGSTSLELLPARGRMSEEDFEGFLDLVLTKRPSKRKVREMVARTRPGSGYPDHAERDEVSTERDDERDEVTIEMEPDAYVVVLTIGGRNLSGFQEAVQIDEIDAYVERCVHLAENSPHFLNVVDFEILPPSRKVA